MKYIRFEVEKLAIPTIEAIPSGQYWKKKAIIVMSLQRA